MKNDGYPDTGGVGHDGERRKESESGNRPGALSGLTSEASCTNKGDPVHMLSCM